jgi:acetyl-CoA synthetase
MLKGGTYEEIRRDFRWNLPEHFNIGVDVCDKWAADPDRLALVYVDSGGAVRRFTFAQLRDLSNRLANALTALGVTRGDRVAVFLPQCPEALLAHIAVYKSGAVALPLLTLFGTAAVEHRLRNCAAKAVISDGENAPKVLQAWERLPHLKTILATGTRVDGRILDFWSSIERGSRTFRPVATRSQDPAVIIYTSGTTGPPKGTLHAHRLLLGLLPGVEFYHNLFPQRGDLMYTPLDWAYIGGSYDALFPALHHGVPVLSFRPRKFDPERMLQVMATHGATNLMAVPTVLRLMMGAVPEPGKRYRLKLRSVTVGGETLGEGLYDWCAEALGVALNEQYGQTECDLVLGFCAAVMEIRRGSIGKAVPGHRVAVIDAEGAPVGPGEFGEIAVRRPDPAMFLGYWKNGEATAAKFVGDWMRTGDYGRRDAEGCFWFGGREDDLIQSGGYRVGPGEIEECLLQHEGVALACVVGVPDAARGEIVRAYIVVKKGVRADRRLEESLRRHVRRQLEAHAYPREIEFLDRMPMTQSGKVRKEHLKAMAKRTKSSRS